MDLYTISLSKGGRSGDRSSDRHMKLGIMQPYFFPYIGYFQLIHATDRYIFLDAPQYERRGGMNRNRILNIQVDWREKVLAQLEIYKKRTSYYSETVDLVRSVLDKAKDSLAKLNIASVVDVCHLIKEEG